MATSLPQVMVCPASGADAHANVERTVANAVPWSSLADRVSPETAEVLQPLLDDANELRFWGFRENSRDRRDIDPTPPQSWRSLVPGTVVVFIGRDRLTYVGTVGAIVFDPDLSELLWGDPEFAWVTPLLNVAPQPLVTQEAIQGASGWERVQMAMPVRAEALEAVHAVLGSSTAAAVPAPVVVGRLVSIDPDAPLSVWTIAERRAEQGILRRALISGATGVCDLCGAELPAPFLRVAHVKQRARCTDAERRDETNLLVACVRCDTAFERGWLGLDEDQNVLISGTRPTTAVLRAQLDELVGRRVGRELNADFVTYHRSNSFVR